MTIVQKEAREQGAISRGIENNWDSTLPVGEPLLLKWGTQTHVAPFIPRHEEEVISPSLFVQPNYNHAELFVIDKIPDNFYEVGDLRIGLQFSQIK